MKLFFLGTSAFEGFPNPFCNGIFCESSRENKINRLRSSAIIDDNILIDFGPDLVASCQIYNKKLFNISILLITHSHPDHLYLPNFGLRMKPYNESYEKICKMKILSNKYVVNSIKNHKYFNSDKSELIEMEPFFKYTYGNYEIIAVPANHKTSSGEQPFIYIIHKDAKTIFYATDTGTLSDEVIVKIQSILDYKIDLLVLDATLGFSNSDFPHHHSYESFKSEIIRFKKADILSKDVRIFAHHFSHHNNDYKYIKEKYEKIGVDVSLDGMEIKI